MSGSGWLLEAEVQMQVLKTQFVYSQAVMMGAQDEIPHFKRPQIPDLVFRTIGFVLPFLPP